MLSMSLKYASPVADVPPLFKGLCLTALSVACRLHQFGHESRRNLCVEPYRLIGQRTTTKDWFSLIERGETAHLEKLPNRNLSYNFV